MLYSDSIHKSVELPSPRPRAAHASKESVDAATWTAMNAAIPINITAITSTQIVVAVNEAFL